MPTSTITLDGNTVTLVPLPSCPAPKMVEPWVNDSVALVTSPFTGQTQAQGSTGADLGGMMVTYPPLQPADAAPLLAWLSQMRGMARVVRLTPPEYAGPQGAINGSSSPVVSGLNVAASTSLSIRGCKPLQSGLLLPWDLIEVNYRLYRVLDRVNTDASGSATFEIFPSVRSDLADGTVINAANPRGLYRLAQNKRNWSVTVDRFTALSFPLMEYR